jgi:hypothetical protein
MYTVGRYYFLPFHEMQGKFKTDCKFAYVVYNIYVLVLGFLLLSV